MDQQALFSWYRQIGQLVVSYYLAAPWPFEPTRSDHERWLSTLPAQERTEYQLLGFDKCQAVNAFRRYWLEEREYCLLDYLRMHLTRGEYEMYRDGSSPLQGPPQRKLTAGVQF